MVENPSGETLTSHYLGRLLEHWEQQAFLQRLNTILKTLILNSFGLQQDSTLSDRLETAPINHTQLPNGN